MDEKRMPFMNFEVVNAKNLNMEFKKTAKIFTEILIIGWHTEI